MLSADLFAVRPGAPDDPVGASPPSLGPAGDPLAAGRAETLRPKVVRGGASAGLSAAAHVAVALLFVAAWRGMVRDVSAPAPVDVTVVHEIPGEKPPPPPPPRPKAETPPPVPEPPKPDPLPLPAAAPEKPAMVEPPPEARAAATQAEAVQPGNSAADPGKPAEAAAGAPAQPERTPAPPPAAPPVLTTASGDTSVAAPASEAPPKPQPAAGEPSQASREATARLAAALPLSTMPMPLSFRAALSAQGTAVDAEYKGSVYGAISRAQKALNDEAYARHLSGRVAIALELAATGEIASLKVVVSSGNATTDKLVLAMVRRAAPFPPPPPGAPRSFTPAIILGDD